jgi:C_GCAxxG_C_C family probable redox protein
VLAVQDVLDMRDDSILKASVGLSGGMGRMGDTCGSLLGAFMMLGLKFGPGREGIAEKLAKATEGSEESERAYLEVGKFYKWFEKEFGSVKCRELRTIYAGVYYDLNIPWQRELSEESGALEKCNEMVKKSAAKVAEILWDALEEEKRSKKTEGKRLVSDNRLKTRRNAGEKKLNKKR